MNSTTCIGCDATEASVVLCKDGLEPKEKDVVLMRCRACGLHFLDSWGQAFNANLYDYYSARIGQSKAERYQPLNTARHGDLLASIGARVRGRVLLDVGCGEGHFVHSALAAGWEARGIDLATSAIRICQDFGLPCDAVDFFAPALDGERFDVLIMSELIEHVPRPARFLARAEELLRPGGIVYLTTPNFASITRRVAGAEWKEIHREHLTYFTPRTFRELVARETNLEPVFLESRNLGIASILARVRPHKRVTTQVSSGSESAEPDDRPPAATNRATEQAVRRRIEQVPALRAMKWALNRALSASSMGDTMVAFLRKS